MSRVTEENVKKIIDTSLEDITLFIETATMMVDEQLQNKGMSEARLTKIELYLSAHFVALRQRQLTSESFGESKETYQGTTGMNLQASLYGQSALLLDTSGSLLNIQSIQGTGKSYAEVELL